MEEKKLIVSSSPHIKSNMTTSRIMLEVCLALIPALIVGVVVFGLYALVIVLTTIASCVLSEYIFNLILKKKHTIGDFSAVVTGLILGLNLPPAVPIYIPIVGGVFAIIIVKMLFGGIGKNFANPAAAARVFLLLAWGLQMTKTFISPLNYGGGFWSDFTKSFSGIGSHQGLDGMTSATPLSPSGEMVLLNMFLGNIGGSIGETSVVALLIGGIYLMVRKIIDWRIPTIFIGSTALFTLVFTGSYSDILPALCGGGLMLGAFFMATDYTTSPNTKNGAIIYALGLGFFTVLLRRLTSMPEGVSYAIVFMNLLCPLIDKYVVPHRFGSNKKPILTIVLSCILAIGFTLGVIGASVGYAFDRNAINLVQAEGDLQNLFYKSKSEKGNVNSAYKSNKNEYVFDATGLNGYKKDDKSLGYVRVIVLIKDNEIVRVKYYQSDQAPIGDTKDVLTDKYLKVYENLNIENKAQIEIGKDVDAQAGATMSSKAIANAVSVAISAYNKFNAGGAHW